MQSHRQRLTRLLSRRGLTPRLPSSRLLSHGLPSPRLLSRLASPLPWLCRALGVLALSLLASCAARTSPRDALVFMAGYKAQANLPFVGVYMAEAQGYFEDEGLDVDIQHSAGGGEHLQLLVAGKVQITTQDAAVLLKRRIDPGLPLVSIGMIGQRGQQAFVALANSGIETLEDWRGRKIGFKGTPPPELLALLAVAGLSQDDVELINVGFDPRVLTEGLVDVYPVYTSNEPYTLHSWGYDLVLWDPADYGVPTLGLAYVTTDATMEAQPDELARFMHAALRGIAYAEAHPDEAVEAVLRYTGPETDRGHMRYMLLTEIEAAYGPTTQAHAGPVYRGLGWQTAEQWQSLQESLLANQAIAQRIDVGTVFTNRFLPEDQ